MSEREYIGKGPYPILAQDETKLLRHRWFRFCRLRSLVDGHHAWSIDQVNLGPDMVGLAITCDRCGGTRRL